MTALSYDNPASVTTDRGRAAISPACKKRRKKGAKSKWAEDEHMLNDKQLPAA